MNKWDNRWLGLGLGILGPLLILFGIQVFSYPEMTFPDFFMHSLEAKTMASWLKPAVLFNLAPFMLFINIHRMRIAQGIVFATMALAAVVAVLTFM